MLLKKSISRLTTQVKSVQSTYDCKCKHLQSNLFVTISTASFSHRSLYIPSASPG